jgi:hypothetical protein
MKVEQFKELTNHEPVILHTDNGRTGKKHRRITVAATVADNKLIIAKSVCGDLDQFQKRVGVAHSLGRLFSTFKSVNNVAAFNKVKERYRDLVEVKDWPFEYNRKEVLQWMETEK